MRGVASNPLSVRSRILWGASSSFGLLLAAGAAFIAYGLVLQAETYQQPLSYGPVVVLVLQGTVAAALAAAIAGVTAAFLFPRHAYLALCVAMLPTWLWRWLPNFDLSGRWLTHAIEWYEVAILILLPFVIARRAKGAFLAPPRSGNGADKALV